MGINPHAVQGSAVLWDEFSKQCVRPMWNVKKV